MNPRLPQTNGDEFKFTKKQNATHADLDNLPI